MDPAALFTMEVKNLFGITSGVGIVFEGVILMGEVALGDKVEYAEDDGTRISATVKKIVVKDDRSHPKTLFSTIRAQAI